ncbi:MAG: DUF305 domain-containing protein [Clostridium sp.]
MKKLFIMGLIFSQMVTLSAFATPKDTNEPKKEKEKTSFQSKMDENSYMNDYSKVFDKMKKAMTSAQVTGNIDMDFLSEMIPHHEGAIGMSEAILKDTNNEDIKKLANSIITEQKAGVKSMQVLLDKLKKESSNIDKNADEKYIKEYKKIITEMFNDMSKVKPSKNSSLDFLEQMLPHHEGGIEMSQEVLKYTKNPEIKAIAENIIKSQKAQEPLMKDLINKLSSSN